MLGGYNWSSFHSMKKSSLHKQWNIPMICFYSNFLHFHGKSNLQHLQHTTHTEHLSFTVKCSMAQCLNLVKSHLYITITNFLLCQTSETLLESLSEHCLDTSKIFITDSFGTANSMSKSFNEGMQHELMSIFIS